MIARSCATGKQQSFQLDGNKVWWAQDAKASSRGAACSGLDGKPLRLPAASSIPPTKLAASGSERRRVRQALLSAARYSPIAFITTRLRRRPSNSA